MAPARREPDHDRRRVRRRLGQTGRAGLDEHGLGHDAREALHRHRRVGQQAAGLAGRRRGAAARRSPWPATPRARPPPSRARRRRTGRARRRRCARSGPPGATTATSAGLRVSRLDQRGRRGPALREPRRRLDEHEAGVVGARHPQHVGRLVAGDERRHAHRLGAARPLGGERGRRAGQARVLRQQQRDDELVARPSCERRRQPGEPCTGTRSRPATSTAPAPRCLRPPRATAPGRGAGSPARARRARRPARRRRRRPAPPVSRGRPRAPRPAGPPDRGRA